MSSRILSGKVDSYYTYCNWDWYYNVIHTLGVQICYCLNLLTNWMSFLKNLLIPVTIGRWNIFHYVGKGQHLPCNILPTGSDLAAHFYCFKLACTGDAHFYEPSQEVLHKAKSATWEYNETHLKILKWTVTWITVNNNDYFLDVILFKYSTCIRIPHYWISLLSGGYITPKYLDTLAAMQLKTHGRGIRNKELSSLVAWYWPEKSQDVHIFGGSGTFENWYTFVCPDAVYNLSELPTLLITAEKVLCLGKTCY